MKTWSDHCDDFDSWVFLLRWSAYRLVPHIRRLLHGLHHRSCALYSLHHRRSAQIGNGWVSVSRVDGMMIQCCTNHVHVDAEAVPVSWVALAVIASQRREGNKLRSLCPLWTCEKLEALNVRRMCGAVLPYEFPYHGKIHGTYMRSDCGKCWWRRDSTRYRSEPAQHATDTEAQRLIA